MSRFGQQWRGFAAWADTVEPAPSARGAASAVVVREPVPLSALNLHRSPLIGYACPRCKGEIVRAHPQDDLACLQCGFEPIQKRPASYVFEPHEDASATSRAAMLPERDDRNGPVKVRVTFAVAANPLICVACGDEAPAGERLRLNRCSACYREHFARLRFGVA